MFFKINFEDPNIGQISDESITFLNFTNSLYMINSTAELKIVDISRKLFNKIKTGSKLTVVFYDDKNEYSNEMSIFSFNKQISTSTSDILNISLISSAYYNDSIKTTAYSGTVSQILYKVCNDNFKYKKVNWSDSDDISRYRYQISERNHDFMLRLLKYGTIKETPIFLYSDARGYLNLKGEYDLRHETPKYFLTIGLTDKTNQKFDISNTMVEVLMDSVTSKTGEYKSSSSIISKFNTVLFKSPNSFKSEKESIGIENKNAQSSTSSPNRVDFYDWNISPSDALSIAIRNNYMDLYDKYYLSATINSLSPDIFIPGTLVWVVLPFDPTEKSSTNATVNCAEGQYIVQNVNYIYENGKVSTHLILSQVAY